MLDIGWSELLLIGLVALIVVGPKELPGLFRTVGQYVGKARGMAREFQRSMDQAADESGLSEVNKGLKSVGRLNPYSATTSARKYAETLVNPKDLSLEELPADPGSPAKPQSAKPGTSKAQPKPGGSDAATSSEQTPGAAVAAVAPAAKPDPAPDKPAGAPGDGGTA